MVNTLVFTIAFGLLMLVTSLITSNISALLQNTETYNANLKRIVESINATFNIDVTKQITSSVEGFDYAAALGNIADGLSGALGNLIMIILYAVFILTEETSLKNKIKKMFSNEHEYSRVSAILNRINDSSADYIRLKTYVSLLTGLVGYVLLALIGVEAAFFWAFLMFALNYIPTIGSLIATVFPAVFSLMQFGDLNVFLVILIGVGVAEWLIGNVIEPRIMGKSLNLSPLVTILALVVWGQIWGITGMLLSTPITVVMVIVCSQFESTRGVAILLSENGDIDDVFDDAQN